MDWILWEHYSKHCVRMFSWLPSVNTRYKISGILFIKMPVIYLKQEQLILLSNDIGNVYTKYNLADKCSNFYNTS